MPIDTQTLRAIELNASKKYIAWPVNQKLCVASLLLER